MRAILQALKYTDSNDLYDLFHIANNFSASIKRLAIAAEKREKEKKSMEQRKLSDYELVMLQRLRLQRAIMTRYQAGYSYKQIAAYLNFHPKTIARYIRKFQTDLSILAGLEEDLDKEKVLIISDLVKKGATKRQIVQRLHCSAYLVSMVCNLEKLKIAA